MKGPGRTRGKERTAIGGVLVLALGLLAAASLRPDPAGAIPPESEVWSQYRAPHFVIFSNAGEERARKVAEDLEGLRRALGQVTRLEMASPLPTHIFLFDDDTSLHPYKHRYRGEPASLTGAFYTGTHADYITMNGQMAAQARVTIFHEYVHGVLRNNLPGLPLWLDEGLAEFFSTFQAKGGQARIGKPVPWHIGKLRADLLPLTEVLGADVSSPFYNEFEHQGVFYAQSWSLVHYLLIGNPNRRRQATDYLNRTLRGEDPSAAFGRAFGVEPAVLEKELANYVAAGLRHRRVPLADDRRVELEIATLSRADLLYHLGDLLAHQGGRRDDAAFHFQQALDLDPGHGLSLMGLGVLAWGEGEHARGRAYFSRAVEAGGGHYLPHYHYGSSLLAWGRATGRGALDKARRHLRESVRLEPGFAPAWARLSYAYTLGAEVDGEALEAGRRAHALLPTRPEVALQLLLLYSRTRQLDAARELVEAYFEPRGGEALQAARQVLERMDWLAAGDSPTKPGG